MNAPAAKGDAFVLKPQPLFHARGAAQFDVAAGAYYAMPGNCTVRRAQGPRDLPGIARMTSGARHVAIGCDLAFRNLPDRLDQFSEHTEGLRDRRRFANFGVDHSEFLKVGSEPCAQRNHGNDRGSLMFRIRGDHS